MRTPQHFWTTPRGGVGGSWVLGALLVAACGGSAKQPPATPVAPEAIASDAGFVTTPPDGHTLTRSAVRAIVAQGLGAFLQRVELDDKPVRVGGKFHGFRIAALHGAFWNGVDLKPGDVVTQVNGLPIERPEQALKAFDALNATSELRVSYDRDGEPRELVYAIVDDQ